MISILQWYANLVLAFLAHQHGQCLDTGGGQHNVLAVVDLGVVLNFVERRYTIPFQSTNSYLAVLKNVLLN